MEKNLSNTLLEYKLISPKSRQQIYQENYQKNKEHKKQQQKERYQQDKERIKAQKKINYVKKKEKAQLSTKQQLSKYYGAEAIKVLMSLKEYTELNQQKHKLWADFNWTLKDCAEDIHDVAAIMKLEQVAGNLVRDYWKTAKAEEAKGKSWDSLSEEQQAKLIKYWGYEKARIENGYIDEEEKLEKKGEEYEKEIKQAKYHEERGKIGCDCYSCIYSKEIRKEIEKKDRAIFEFCSKESEKERDQDEKEECPECGKMRVLNEETGACKKCSDDYGN